MGGMETPAPRRLSPGAVPAAAAAAVLALLWIVGMPMFDTNACTSFPLVAGMGGVLLLVLSAMVCGFRPARFTWLNLLSLAVGGYFLVRCLHSYAVAESWRESVIIVGCMLFYLAGIQAGQGKHAGWVAGVFVAALVLNMAALFLLHGGGVPIEWTGRPAYGFCGQNHIPVALFTYKNFSALFLCAGGMLTAYLAFSLRRYYLLRAVLLFLACGAVGLSFFCGSRGVYVLLPLLAVPAWLLYVVGRLYRNEGVGVLNILIGVGVSGGVLYALFDFFSGGMLFDRLMNTDTHLRGMIWQCICREAPQAPLWGYGTSASHWGILHLFNEWNTPNYAHNEYLQVWMDYGVLGMGGMAFILAVHFWHAFHRIGAESVSPAQRSLTSFSLLLCLSLCVYAVADFPWHHFSLAGATAFACGVMGAACPPAAEQPAQVQGYWGRGVTGLLCLAGLAYAGWMGNLLYHPWQAQWQLGSMMKRQAPAAECRALLAEVLPAYPDPALMDFYYSFPEMSPDYPKQEQLLKTALRGNPRQLYIVTMLADVMTRQGKYRDTEALLRERYYGNGMKKSLMMNWAAFYVTNLLQWGRAEMYAGNTGLAYSLLDYGLNIGSHYETGHFYRLAYRANAEWTRSNSYKDWTRKLEEACRRDCHRMQLMKVEKDDSWMEPMSPGGKRALYPANGADGSRRRKVRTFRFKKHKKSQKNHKR